MKTTIHALLILFMGVVFVSSTQQEQEQEAEKTEDECPCKSKKELTQKDLLCMNSCAKIYSCLTNKDIKPEEVFSYAFEIYTGEETIINRYNKDELPLIVKNNILKAKRFRIRGVRLKNSEGKPSDTYYRKIASIKFKDRKIEPN